MPKDFAHDFYDVIEHHAEREAEATKGAGGFFSTHPLEYGEEPASNAAASATNIYQTHKYDFIPRYKQFEISDGDQVEELEALMERLVKGDGVLRREQTSTTPRGDFIILVAWLERKEKKQPRKRP